MGSTTIVAVAPMLYLINADVVGDTLFYIIALIAGITISINGKNINAESCTQTYSFYVIPYKMNLNNYHSKEGATKSHSLGLFLT
jgi:hypothetical protein